MHDDGYARYMRDHGIESDGGESRRMRTARMELEMESRRCADFNARRRIRIACKFAADVIAAATGDALDNMLRYLAFGLSEDAAARLDQQVQQIRILRSGLLRELEALSSQMVK